MAGVLRGSGHTTNLMADLLAIRTRLVNEAGRFDLVVDAENDDFDDNGANQVINDAIGWLNTLRADIENVLTTESFALLVVDTDENFWSADHPHVLVNAARRMLETRQRNTAGVNDWNNVVLPEVDQIYANAVQAEINEDVATDPEARVMKG